MNKEEDFKWYMDLVTENSMTWDGFKKVFSKSPGETWPNKSSLVLLIDELIKSRKELDELKNNNQKLEKQRDQNGRNFTSNVHQNKDNTTTVVKTEIVEVDLTDETAQNITSDQSLIQEAHEEAKLRAANSAIQEIPQSKIDTAANVQTQNESENGSQPHPGEPQPSTSGSISNQDQGIEFGRNPNHQQQQNGDSVIKADNFIFEFEDSNVDNKIKTEVLKTENFENGDDSAAKNLSEVKQEISNRNLENTQRTANIAIQEIPQSKIGTSANAQTQNESKNGSQPHIGEPQPSTSGSISNQEIVRKFRLNVLLKVKEGEERKLVEEILRPGDPISLKFSTNDENIRLVMSQSKIQNQDLEFWATFELRCDGFEGFDLERVTNHLTINPINCPRIRTKVVTELLILPFADGSSGTYSMVELLEDTQISQVTTNGENDAETAAERTTISGIENSNDDEHGESSSKRRRVENSNPQQGAILSSSLLPQPVPSKSRSRSKSKSLEPNQESNGIIYHTCEENQLKICPACYQFKFEYKGDEEVIVIAGTHSYKFKLELSRDVYYWFLERVPRLKLLELPNSKDFHLLTKSVVFQDKSRQPNENQYEPQELGPGKGHPIEIRFRTSHIGTANLKGMAKKFVAQIPKNLYDEMLHNTQEDILSFRTTEVYPLEKSIWKLRLPYNSRYSEGDEVKIEPLRIRNFTMEIGEDFNRLYKDEKSKYVVTNVTLKNTSVDETFIRKSGFKVGKILHMKTDSAMGHGQ